MEDRDDKNYNSNEFEKDTLVLLIFKIILLLFLIAVGVKITFFPKKEEIGIDNKIINTGHFEEFGSTSTTSTTSTITRN